MMQFGLVAEGESDHIVIERILMGFLDDSDLLVTPMFPLRDETDKATATGGWGNLREYLKSGAFQLTFQAADIVVVHIDTDKSEEYGVSKKVDAKERTVQELVAAVELKIQEWIGEFFELVRDRVVFAISVHEIECWILPIYFPIEKAKRGKTTSCIKTLNEVLPSREGFYIKAKEYKYYEKMSRPFRKQKELMKLAPFNPSLEIFVGNLDRIVQVK